LDSVADDLDPAFSVDSFVDAVMLSIVVFRRLVGVVDYSATEGSF
jgi:hypothetical protein